MAVVGRHFKATAFQEAAQNENLREWTILLTEVSVQVCENMGWQATAQNHKLDLLPIPRSEYLSMDVMAFAKSDHIWRFPIAILELENSLDDNKIAYSLWKVLCVRCDLRMVICYRRSPDDITSLLELLRKEIIDAMSPEMRTSMPGDTCVVVGCKEDASRFPYGFFKWWLLDKGTGRFRTF
jgi:hypothetical protein